MNGRPVSGKDLLSPPAKASAAAVIAGVTSTPAAVRDRTEMVSVSSVTVTSGRPGKRDLPAEQVVTVAVTASDPSAAADSVRSGLSQRRRQRAQRDQRLQPGRLRRQPGRVLIDQVPRRQCDLGEARDGPDPGEHGVVDLVRP